MSNNPVSLAEIQQWLVGKVADLANKKPEEIDMTQPLADYGFDSVQAVGFSGDIEEKFQLPIEPTLIWDYPTITQIAGYLLEEIKI